ncbi:glycine betaine ABC transporter substrate-binding protein [Dictyobacter arantiisoli]|uniref:Glycine/betaine ABC transporter substrate-binding protein n=1 Tax=Dictyobacter arantiisoli TaxID=2014874 RepID=A0A5A5TGG6_9CHLR|nr:glycine betaine ABC transporter substrate-binding protein [Dictyobacter arantiisoli]GCF10680.1 glycine/betaine ABC transporter substrate-binding protein [Dictyobacter arantiisoli]
MPSLFRSLRAKTLVIFACLPLFILAACGNSSTTTTGGGSSPSNPNANVTLTVGGKLDTESKILTKIYTLALRDAGFKVNEKAAFGNNTIVFSGIKSGAIDLYPEFTATGLDALKKTSSLDDAKDYQTVKDGFKQQFQIDWLDYAPLNDTYAVCVQQGNSLGLKTISDLASKAKQVTFDLPSDSTYVFDYLKPKYNLTLNSFKDVHKVDYTIGFKEVSGGQAQANFCYSTDGGITTNKLTVLADDQHAFPAYHPAPIVRASVLSKSPDIATALNALAPKLTTQTSLDLQQQVAKNMNNNMSQNQAIYQAAKAWLQNQGLCKKSGCANS